MTRLPPAIGLVLTALAGFAPDATAQWTNRYPKVTGFSHHVYLEGYELPSVTIGPIDAVPAPDGHTVALASRGWLWLFDQTSGVATRLTKSGPMDSRPAWSPDQRHLAFVRDDGKETSIAMVDLTTGVEKTMATDKGIELDPAFSPDGKTLFYSSAVAGDLDIWRVDLSTGTKERVTQEAGLELKPMPHPDGKRLVYLAKKGAGQNEVRIRDLATGTERVLVAGSIVSMARPALSPNGTTVAVNWPTTDGATWDLRLIGVEQPGPVVVLVASGLPLTPAWSADGSTIYFSQADQHEVMALHQVPTGGGPATEVAIGQWDYGAPTNRLVVKTTDRHRESPARLSVVDENGHPLLPDQGQPRFDGQNGMVFFYSGGATELTVPARPVTVTAVRGLATPAVTKTVAGSVGSTVELDLEPVWDARAHGWMAGEHHFHLNYGGPYRLDPSDLAPMALGEDMDVLTPLLANLHTRFEDQPLFQWRALAERPFIAFGQEVRSHFFGHIGLVGTDELFWPWIWGPGYEIYSRDDRPNRTVLEWSRQQGGFSVYVHPVSRPNPFAAGNYGTIPTGFIADAVQGMVDGIELACLWSDELGTADLWYRVLNLGFPVAPSAGTDVMNNLYRTMAVGTTRVYVKADSTTGYRGYLDNLKAGRSFVTNGPMLDFRIGSAGPGEVIPPSSRKVPWSVHLASAVAVSRLELVVNGTVVDSTTGVAGAGSRDWAGSLSLPSGGWIAIRAVGGAIDRWPAMDSYAFAHTAPVWIGAKGSTLPAAKAAAAKDLLAAFEVAEANFKRTYAGSPAPALSAHYQRAREILTAMAAGR